MRDWLRSKLQAADIRVVLIILFIIVSTGHIGRLFADREAGGQWFIGYILALAIDAALAISLYEMGYVQEKAHRLLALIGFLAACTISGGFNVYYYRQFYPSDPWPLSILLGLAAPVLAAFFAVLKAKGDVQRQKTIGMLEIEKFKLEQETRKTIALETEKEKTKRAKERTKLQQIKAQTEAKAEEDLQKERKGLTTSQRRQAVFDLLCKDIDQSPADLGKRFDVTAQTIRNDLKALAKEGKITYKGGRVSLRPQIVEAQR